MKHFTHLLYRQTPVWGPRQKLTAVWKKCINYKT